MKYFQYFRNSFSLTQEELAASLSLGRNAITLYESGKAFPTFKVLNNFIKFYQVSFDFFLLNENCAYPRNLKLLNLVKKLDNPHHSESRNTIESSARSLLNEKYNTDFIIKQDKIDIDLHDNFHLNLKEIRNHRQITQLKLGRKIGVSRTLIAQYELKIYPPMERLIEISEILDISAHALATGQKLSFDFQDRIFGQTMLLADHFLSLDDHKLLIRLMESALTNKNLIYV